MIKHLETKLTAIFWNTFIWNILLTNECFIFSRFRCCSFFTDRVHGLFKESQDVQPGRVFWPFLKYYVMTPWWLCPWKGLLTVGKCLFCFSDDSMVESLRCRGLGCIPCVRKIPWRRKWQPTPVFFILSFFILSWRIVALQHGACFWHTSTWVSHRYTYVSSLLKLSPTSHPISPARL